VKGDKMGQKEFKDIKIRCYSFSLSIIQFIDLISIKRIFYSLIDQLLRSSTSIGANIVEARSAHSKKDFIKFYEISLKSANETKYWLCLLRDGFKIDKNKINSLLKEANEISKIIASSIVKLKNINANIIKEKYVAYEYNNSDKYYYLTFFEF
jgi:four helix bundle protein